MTQGFILELSDTNKQPGFFGQTKFGVGAVTSTGVYRLLLIGLLATGATITTNAVAVRCTSVDEARTLAGPGGDLCRMAEAALSVPGIENIEVWLAASADAGSAAAAEATLTLGGTWTTTGEWRGRLAGEDIVVAVTASDTPTTLGDSIEAYITARPWFPVTAVNTTGAIVFTAKSEGVLGNNLILFQDKSRLPTGCTSAITGGAATVNGGVRFASGTGTEDLTTLLAALYQTRFHTIVPSVFDATNVGKVETHVDAAAGPSEGRTQHILVGSNSLTQSSVTSIAQTTLDNQRAEVLWMIEGETPAQEVVARLGAIRTIREQVNPNQDYDGLVLDGVRAQTDKNGSVIPTSSATIIAALDAGITPVITSPTTAVQVVRAVTTRTQDASGNVDDRTVDVGESRTPDRIRDDLKTFWDSSFKPDHPNVEDDPSGNGPDPAPTVAYPKLWTREVTRILLSRQALGWNTRVAENPPTSAFNRTAKRIVSKVPVVVTPINHQIETSVEQVPYSSAA